VSPSLEGSRQAAKKGLLGRGLTSWATSVIVALEMGRLGRATTAGLLVFLAVLAPERAQASDPPSIVLIVTDDQRADTLWAMPIVQAELADHGVTFTNAFATNPLCCPSRASILTGQYSHGTGVWTNRIVDGGGFPAFDDSSTLATWLDAAGYRTGFFGKYLNGYSRFLHKYVPPGWDRWFGYEGGYFNYWVSDDGVRRDFGTAEEEYSTDVLVEEAVSFIEGSDEPVFVLFAPYAPHVVRGWQDVEGWSPLPAPRHADTFPDLTPLRPPSFNETDVSDKPPWIQSLNRTEAEIERLDIIRRTQLQSLLAVDEGVGRILAALENTGRLENTVVIFTSDNGYALGEHRWVTKVLPYEESIRVPLIVRHDRLGQEGTIRDDLVGNVDLAPTIAELAGVSAPDSEGVSLVSSLRDGRAVPRSSYLLENSYHLTPSAYCGLRTEHTMYAQYADGFEELYDLRRDPHQLENVAGRPSFGRTLVTRRERVSELCSPPPPGLSLRSPCLRTGTASGDVLVGSRFFDYLCAGAGHDTIRSRGGSDRAEAGRGKDLVVGGRGGDHLKGGLGRDHLHGGRGHDNLAAIDGLRDVLSCGRGQDTARVDAQDFVQTDCERVFRQRA
jgi:N-acetylglucosamine-6-sulfatase